jgi:DNA-binding IclR family transcriptional regulator
MSDAEVARILNRQAAEMLDKYDVTVEDAMRSIAQARVAGYAINPGRVFPDSWAIGIALIDKAGVCRGSLALAGIQSRIDVPRAEELGTMLSRISADCMNDWAKAQV